MKKTYLSIVSIAVIVLMIASVSACVGNCPVEKTIVSGKVFDQSTGKNVAHADVEVICHGENGDKTKTTKTNMFGIYSVMFLPDDCEYGDQVTVNAEKSTKTGTNTGEIDKELNRPCLELDIGVIDVPLVPEFTTIVGIMTAMASMGIFFFVRRK